VLKEDVNLPTN